MPVLAASAILGGRMLYDRLRVFVSSRMAELAAERAAIKEVLDELHIDAWVFEHDAGARPETIQEAYTEELDNADLYVGVFWKGYGGHSVDEYEHARRTGKDCLVYQKDGDRIEGRAPELQAFLDRIGKVESGLTVQFFETVDELREMVKRDAARWQTRIVRKYREAGPRRGAAGLPADPDLVVLRDKVRHFWIDGVLGRAVGTGLMDLAGESRPEAVDHRWEAVLELPYEGSRVIDSSATVLDVFDELQGSLLVLGQPGSGKTTTALQLTRDLIERSERESTQPVPVVLNLSTWSPQPTSFIAWIAKEISAKYQIPASCSRPWLEQGRLVLILDGLDEVAAEVRESCVAAINTFAEEHALAGLVVTCRLEEYEALAARLRTHGAVCLQPLGPGQVDAYLEGAGPRLDGLRTALETDETLAELARSPLMLSVMSVAYRDRSAAELSGETGPAAQRQARLFATYVDRAFEEPGTARSYSRKATTAWLSWLARRMAARNQVVFLIENLQPSWLARQAHLAAYLVGAALWLGLVYGGLCILYRTNPSAVPENPRFGLVNWIGSGEVLAWLVACPLWFLGIGLSEGLPGRAVKEGARAIDPRRVLTSLVLFGLMWAGILGVFLAVVDVPQGRVPVVLGLPIGMTVGAAAFCARRSLTRSIRTTESLALRWSRARRGALWGLPVGLGFGAIGYYFLEGHDPGTLVFWPMLIGVFGALLAGFEPRIVRGKTVPNQGMLLTLWSALRAGQLAILLAAAVALACVVRGGVFLQAERVLTWAAFTFLFFFVNLAMWFGGIDLGKHFLLRGIIGCTRQGPYDFPRLLADASRRNLMQRVGGGHIFAHRLLLDHFAEMDLPAPARGDVHTGGLVETSAAFVGMIALAVLGLMLLLVGVHLGSAATIVLGSVGLGVGALWLVVRSAVTSALRAVHREPGGG